MFLSMNTSNHKSYNQEKFVEVFARLLKQSDKTTKY